MTDLRDFPPTHAEIALAAYYLWLHEVSDTNHPNHPTHLLDWLHEVSDKNRHTHLLDADANWFIAERRLTEEWHRRCREEDEIQDRGPEL
jgi:hypothetical protein